MGSPPVHNGLDEIQFMVEIYYFKNPITKNRIPVLLIKNNNNKLFKIKIK
jgi:hypothetical protein